MVRNVTRYIEPARRYELEGRLRYLKMREGEVFLEFYRSQFASVYEQLVLTVNGLIGEITLEEQTGELRRDNRPAIRQLEIDQMMQLRTVSADRMNRNIVGPFGLGP